MQFTICTCVAECKPLARIINGSISCYLGPSNDDICNVTCNKGYVLSGSDTRTCQDDGNWSGTDGSCKLGTIYITAKFIVSSPMVYSGTSLNKLPQLRKPPQ